ncbi:MAG: hypothetical protein WA077_24645, partial [Anaerolineae bacterium]
AGSVIACYFRFVIDRTAILDRFLASAFERRATVLDDLLGRPITLRQSHLRGAADGVSHF